MENIATLDVLDRQIMRGLQIAPRVPFNRLGAVLGVAEQTVARRYRRLRREGLIRVTAAVNPAVVGATIWLIRLRCRPEAARAIARALADRDDVSWVTIHSAGWEVDFNLRSTRAADAEDLLGRMLPKAVPVLDVAAAAQLRVFVGGASTDWSGLADLLTPEQVSALEADSGGGGSGGSGDGTDGGGGGGSGDSGGGSGDSGGGSGGGGDGRVTLTDDDRPLVQTLQRDGRASVSALARVTGRTPGRISRRLEALLASGVLYLDIDVAPSTTGQLASSLWLTVAPRHLESVGTALAEQPGIPFAAAITGSTNLVATLLGDDLAGAYRFVTTTLAGLEGVTGYEIAPRTSLVKLSGALVTGDRLAPPAPARR